MMTFSDLHRGFSPVKEANKKRGEPFQRFSELLTIHPKTFTLAGKPLKRLLARMMASHRAKATVLMNNVPKLTGVHFRLGLALAGNRFASAVTVC